MDNCIFCKIVQKKIPAAIIWEDKKHIAFLDIFPNTLGFTIVAVKKHLPSYAFDNSDLELTELIIATKKVSNILDTFFSDVARCGMFFEGYGVDHLHSKLSPMHGTSNMKSWKPIEHPRNKYYKIYPGYLSSHSASRASDEELKVLSEKIRKSIKK